MEDISPQVFISEINPDESIDFNPIFEVKFMNGREEPSSIMSKSEISDFILQSMEKEEEKVMEKNRAMKWKSYGNEANILHEAMKQSDPNYKEIQKPDCPKLTENWFLAME